MNGKVDLGSNVWIEWYRCAAHGEGSGVIITWRSSGEEGADCSGTVSICGCDAPKRPRWLMLSREPLTLEPSIQCRTHPQHHGWIRGGRWVPA